MYLLTCICVATSMDPRIQMPDSLYSQMRASPSEPRIQARVLMTTCCPRHDSQPFLQSNPRLLLSIKCTFTSLSLPGQATDNATPPCLAHRDTRDPVVCRCLLRCTKEGFKSWQAGAHLANPALPIYASMH